MRVNDIWASRFKLMQRLNHGATSEVWMAFDTQSTDNNIVALKVLTGNQDILTTELFYRETEALSLITHKNIVAIMDYGFDEECQRYWLALEYIKGKTLDQYLQTAKPDTWTALDIMKDIVEAVVFAHANNVIHRDLKPKNIMLDETGTAIVLDFGIAKMKASLQEQMSVGNMGTRPYAAPEQGTRQADFRLDIHALGGILLYLLTGVAPNTDSILADQVKAASLTAEQKDLLLKMVDQNPEQRLPSILHLKRALVRLLDYERKASTVVYARITQKIINAMESLGIINNNKHWEEALAWLNNELNSTETFIEETDYGSYYIYTSKYSIRFDQDAKDECIYLADIKQLVSADILNNKGWAVSFKSNWRVLPKNGTLPKDACLEDLFNAINDHKIKRNVKKQREAQLKNTVVQWEKILRLQRKLLTENNFSLEYKS